MSQVLLNDRDWSMLAHRICLVSQFIPFARVEGEKVILPDRAKPYALIVIEDRENNERVAGEFVGAVTHRLDFEALWRVFSTRGVGGDETVNVYWSKRKLKASARLFSPFMPRLAVTIWKTEAFRLIYEREYRPELRGEARALAGDPPLLHFQPKMWKEPLVSTKLEEYFEKWLQTDDKTDKKRHLEHIFQILSGPNTGNQSENDIWEQAHLASLRWYRNM